jgi:predicted metal-binding membrane protein
MREDHCRNSYQTHARCILRDVRVDAPRPARIDAGPVHTASEGQQLVASAKMGAQASSAATWRTPCLANPMFSGIDTSMVHPAARDEHPPTILESALRYDRTPAVILLVLVPLISWMWIVVMARDMYGPMTGASAWMMTAVWDVPHLLLLWAMWAVMMTGMMLPSASPMLLLYGIVARRSAQETAARQLYALAAGYLMVWAVFSLGATALQRLLAAFLLVSPMMENTSPAVGATLLLFAGVYQLSPIKHACLRTCQSPLGFLMSRWRSGFVWCIRDGPRARRILRGVLLGADVAAVCGRRDELGGHRGADGICRT